MSLFIASMCVPFTAAAGGALACHKNKRVSSFGQLLAWGSLIASFQVFDNATQILMEAGKDSIGQIHTASTLEHQKSGKLSTDDAITLCKNTEILINKRLGRTAQGQPNSTIVLGCDRAHFVAAQPKSP